MRKDAKLRMRNIIANAALQSNLDTTGRGKEKGSISITTSTNLEI
jgi:hypothetical protein